MVPTPADGADWAGELFFDGVDGVPDVVPTAADGTDWAGELFFDDADGPDSSASPAVADWVGELSFDDDSALGAALLSATGPAPGAALLSAAGPPGAALLSAGPPACATAGPPPPKTGPGKLLYFFSYLGSRGVPSNNTSQLFHRNSPLLVTRATFSIIKRIPPVYTNMIVLHVRDMCEKCVYPRNLCGVMISPIPCDQFLLRPVQVLGILQLPIVILTRLVPFDTAFFYLDVFRSEKSPICGRISRAQTCSKKYHKYQNFCINNQ